MRVQVNFKIVNPEYDQEYADQYHGGVESESNWKYTWAVMYEVKDVKSVSIIENEDFVLTGRFEDEQEFNFRISNVMIYRCYFEEGSYEDFAVSKSILNSTHQANKEGYDVTRFYFYLNADPPSLQLSNNIVVDRSDVPSELLE